MGDNLPVVHSREEPEDLLEADSEDEAVLVSRYHEHHAVAIGDEDKGEWLIAPTSYDVDLFR